jgi:hypothetical protein
MLLHRFLHGYVLEISNTLWGGGLGRLRTNRPFREPKGPCPEPHESSRTVVALCI